MTLHEISAPLRPALHHYDGDPPVTIEPWTRLAAGDLADVSRLSLSTHAGTHVDAPSHFLPGAAGVEAIDLGACVGPAIVLDLSDLHADRIDRPVLEALLPRGTERLLLKTRNSSYWQAERPRTDFVALTADAAQWLVERGLRLVGIDYLSIAPFDDPAPVHRVLLSAGVVVLEGLDLSAITAGSFMLICLPLLVPGVDGAPARAVLLDGSSGL